jgi:hypothetical protein
VRTSNSSFVSRFDVDFLDILSHGLMLRVPKGDVCPLRYTFVPGLEFAASTEIGNNSISWSLRFIDNSFAQKRASPISATSIFGALNGRRPCPDVFHREIRTLLSARFSFHKNLASLWRRLTFLRNHREAIAAKCFSS